MSHETLSQQPDLLLDYYERHFLRTLGNHACSNYGFVDDGSDIERVLKLYDPSTESIAVTDSFVRPPDATLTDHLGLLASRARIWGDVTSREIAARKIFSVADSRGPDSEVSDETIVRTLVRAGRPDIAHVKLKAYRHRLGENYRHLLYNVGEGYCSVAKSTEDLQGVPNIIDELKVGDPKPRMVTINKWGIFKRAQIRTDATKQRFHKDLQAHLNGARRQIEHPELFEYNITPVDSEPYPYAVAYREGGLRAALELHKYNNRASGDRSAFWPYRTIVNELVESGDLATAHKLAEEGLIKISEEHENGATPASIHYGIIRYVIEGYARTHDLERAHTITTAIPDDFGNTRTAARRMVAKLYVESYARQLQSGNNIPDECLGTAIEYIKQHVPDELERNATFGWVMDVLAPYGQTNAIKRVAAQLPPLLSTPYEHGIWPLFASHVANKDYQACAEYLEYWPSRRLTADALTSVIQEKRRRRVSEAM